MLEVEIRGRYRQERIPHSPHSKERSLNSRLEAARPPVSTDQTVCPKVDGGLG